MKFATIVCCSRRFWVPTLAVSFVCGASVLRAAQEDSPAEWPRTYSVDDDDIVLYPPKVEKWDQKLLVARFAVGVKGKNDKAPIYGSFLATAETQANADERTVSVSHFTTAEFKFPGAEDRLEHIKRDIAAVSPEKPFNMAVSDLKANPPSDEATSEDGPADETSAPEEEKEADDSKEVTAPSPIPTPESTSETLRTKKVASSQREIITMKKGVPPQEDLFEDENSQATEEEVTEAPPPAEVKKIVPVKRVVPKAVAPAAKKVFTTKQDDTAETDAPKIIYRRSPVTSVRKTVLHPCEPKPVVVRRVQSTDRRFVSFEKKVSLSDCGEVVCHHHHSVRIHHVHHLKHDCSR